MKFSSPTQRAGGLKSDLRNVGLSFSRPEGESTSAFATAGNAGKSKVFYTLNALPLWGTQDFLDSGKLCSVRRCES